MGNFNIVNNRIYIQYRVLDKRKTFNTYLVATEENMEKAKLIKKRIEERIEIKNKEVKMKNILKSAGFANSFNRDMTVEKATEIYKYKLELTSKSYQTRFRVAMDNFYKIVPKNMKISKITYEHSLRYVKLLMDKNLSSITVRSYYDHVKVLFQFLVKNKHLNISPFTNDVLPRKTKKAIVTFGEDMLKDILSGAKESDTTFFNILSLLLLTGLRPNDLLRLKAGQLNFATRRIHLRISKTNKEVYIPMSQSLYSFITENMNYIMELESDELIFAGYTVSRLGCRFRRLKKRLGIKEKFIFSLKTFRRNFATRYARGLTIQDVAFLLSHDEIETSKAFYADIIVDEVRTKMDRFDENHIRKE